MSTYLAIRCTCAHLLTVIARIELLVKQIVAFAIETATLREGDAVVTTPDETLVTHTALRTAATTASGRSQTMTCDFTARTTELIVAVNRTLNT